MYRTLFCLTAGLLVVGAADPAASRQDPPYTHDEYNRLDFSKEPWELHVHPKSGGPKVVLVPATCVVDLGPGRNTRDALKDLKNRELLKIELTPESKQQPPHVCKSIGRPTTRSN